MGSAKIDAKDLADITALPTLGRSAAVIIGAGVVAVFVALISMYTTLNRIADEKRKEIDALEARRQELQDAIRTLEADRYRQRELLAKVSREGEGSLSPSLLSQTQNSVAVSDNVSRQIANVLPTVIFVVSDDAQRPIVGRAGEALAAQGFHIPPSHSIRTKGVAPPTTEVRYFRHPDGRLEATEILKALQAAGVAPGRVVHIVDSSTPSNQYEVWFSRDAVIAPVAPPSTPTDSTAPTTTTATDTTTTGA